MEISIIAAVDRNGYIASREHPLQKDWTSEEDFSNLKSEMSKFTLLLLGLNTYKLNSPVAKLENYQVPNDGFHRVILTTKPEVFANHQLPGRRDFISATPEEFVAIYKNRYKKCLILGGASVYKQFYEAELVDEMIITKEPVSIDTGEDPRPLKLFVDYTTDDLDLPKPKRKTLNSRGTELLIYNLV
jgi:dihydrofolate reductase